jgi:hypothetical protein
MKKTRIRRFTARGVRGVESAQRVKSSGGDWIDARNGGYFGGILRDASAAARISSYADVAQLVEQLIRNQ